MSQTVLCALDILDTVSGSVSGLKCLDSISFILLTWLVLVYISYLLFQFKLISTVISVLEK